MPNNLFIGERYIPLFANPVEWDSSRAYEHLTIVMYEEKAIQAGTPYRPALQ